MKVTYELQLTDWQAADRFFAKRRPRPTVRARLNQAFFLLLIAPTILVPAIGLPLQYIQSPTFHAAWKVRGLAALWPISFTLIPILLLIFLWFAAPLLRGHSFRQSPFYGRQITLSLENDGLHGERFIPWAQVHAVEESATHIFIVFGENHLFIIPRHAFDSDFGATQFAAHCRDGQPKI